MSHHADEKQADGRLRRLERIAEILQDTAEDVRDIPPSPERSSGAAIIRAWVTAAQHEQDYLLAHAGEDARPRLRVIDGGLTLAAIGTGVTVAAHHVPVAAAATAGLGAAAVVAGAVYLAPVDLPDVPHPTSPTARPSRRSAMSIPAPRRVHVPHATASSRTGRPEAPTADHDQEAAVTAPTPSPTPTVAPTGARPTPVPVPVPTISAVAPSPPDQHPTCVTLKVVIAQAKACLSPHLTLAISPG